MQLNDIGSFVACRTSSRWDLRSLQTSRPLSYNSICEVKPIPHGRNAAEDIDEGRSSVQIRKLLIESLHGVAVGSRVVTLLSILHLLRLPLSHGFGGCRSNQGQVGHPDGENDGEWSQNMQSVASVKYASKP